MLDRALVGRDFDRSLLADLPPGADPCGERGEFHSCVYAGPMFNEPLALDVGVLRGIGGSDPTTRTLPFRARRRRSSPEDSTP